MKANLGITSLPRNRHLLEDKIEQSLNSFASTITKPKNEIYLFILENLDDGEVVGVSGIYSNSVAANPKYFYRIQTVAANGHTIFPMPKEFKLLVATRYIEESSEIGTLYLSPQYRKEGSGRLLSLSRFLFIAAFRDRFEKKIIAVMRGQIDAANNCPFWEGLGAHFLNVSFYDLIKLLDKDRSFIPKIMPTFPIYITLLSKETQDAIGTIHTNTRPALKMLQNEGFSATEFIDMFDGGPVIMSPRDTIRPVCDSKTALVDSISDELSIGAEQYLISNEHIDYRACLGNITFTESRNAILSTETANALNVSFGNTIRYVLSHGALKMEQ